MKLLLTNIAEIQTGVYCKPEKDGTILYLQAQHFDENGNLPDDFAANPEIRKTDRIRRYLLAGGDILFAAKGERNFAWQYSPEIGAAVASSSFLVLRLKPGANQYLLPEFLVWQLNDLARQQQFRTLASGSSLPSITKQAFARLAVLIPPLDIQYKVLQLQILWDKEKALLHQLTEKKELLYRSLMRKLIREKQTEEKNEGYPTRN